METTPGSSAKPPKDHGRPEVTIVPWYMGSPEQAQTPARLSNVGLGDGRALHKPAAWF